MSLTIVTRKQWGAVAPKSRGTISTPTPKLYLHHTTGSGANEAKIRDIQHFHMAPEPNGRDWADIAYSYLVDNDAPDVDVFEGRGAGVRGGHTKGQNDVSHAICVVGDFSTRAPHDDTLAKVAELVAHGHRRGWWPLGFTGGHRDAPGAATTCPGDALHQLIPSINAEARRIAGTTPDEVATDLAATYVVQPGDTIKRIAAQFGLTVAGLRTANPQIADLDRIRPGQVLDLGTRPVAPPPTVLRTATYVVQPGDTMMLIAGHFRLRLDDLLAANPQIPDPDRIFQGQVVSVPK